MMQNRPDADNGKEKSESQKEMGGDRENVD